MWTNNALANAPTIVIAIAAGSDRTRGTWSSAAIATITPPATKSRAGGRPAADAGSVAAFFRTELTGFLGPLAGEKPEEAVTVEVREEEIGGRTVPLAAVHVAPRVVLEGKPADFNLMLPLTR